MSAIYFDIGGTYVRTEVIKNGRILFYKKVRTAKNRIKFISQLKSVINKLVKKYNCQQICFGVAGVVSGSKVISCANIKYLSNFDFKKIVPPQVKILVDNDARAWLSQIVVNNPQFQNGTILGITVGTGIGRAVARDGKILKIKKFEHREKWESEYQQRKFEPSPKLARWFAEKLRPIINFYKPDFIVLAGGVIEKKPGFYRELVNSLSKGSPKVKVVKVF